MSVNNVNQNTDIQKLLKLMKQNGKGKTTLSQKVPTHMTMNGSIFDANIVSSSSATKTTSSRKTTSSNAQTASNVVKANTSKSVSNITTDTRINTNSQVKDDPQTDNDTKDIDLSNYDFDNLTNVSDSELQDLKDVLTELKNSDVPRFLLHSVDRKLSKVNNEIQKRREGTNVDNNDNDNNEQSLKDAQNDTAQGEAQATKTQESGQQAKALTSQTQQATADTQESSKQMQSLNSKMQKDDKKFKKDVKKAEQEIKENQKKITREQQQMQMLAQKSTQINDEITTLSSNLNVTGLSDSEIQSTQAQIVAKSEASATVNMQIAKSGLQIKNYTVKNNKLTNTITRSTKQYNTQAKRNVVAVQEEKTKTDKVLDIANKSDEILGYVVMGGTATKYVGKSIRWTGQLLASTPWGAAAGAAMITTGTWIQTIGTGVETVGNYGKCAVNVTKTVAYACKGDIAGAFMSAGAAVMSATSAAQGTKDIINSGKALMNQASQASSQVKEVVDKGKDVVKEGTEKTADVVKSGTKEAVQELTRGEKLQRGMATMAEFGTFVQSAGSMFQKNQTTTGPVQQQVYRTAPPQIRRKTF